MVFWYLSTVKNYCTDRKIQITRKKKRDFFSTSSIELITMTRSINGEKYCEMQLREISIFLRSQS